MIGHSFFKKLKPNTLNILGAFTFLAMALRGRIRFLKMKVFLVGCCRKLQWWRNGRSGGSVASWVMSAWSGAASATDKGQCCQVLLFSSVKLCVRSGEGPRGWCLCWGGSARKDMGTHTSAAGPTHCRHGKEALSLNYLKGSSLCNRILYSVLHYSLSLTPGNGISQGLQDGQIVLQWTVGSNT